MASNKRGLVPIRSPEQYCIPKELPEGFREKQIIYRLVAASSSPLRLYYKGRDKPTKVDTAYGGIKAFVKAAKKKYKKNKGEKEEKKRLDFVVSKDSYVIIALSKKSGLEFSPLNPAITLSSESPKYPKNIYGALRYVDEYGDVYESPIENCRMAFFAAKFKEGTELCPHVQGLNYNVVTVDGVITVIDPDIRHPGLGE